MSEEKILYRYFGREMSSSDYPEDNVVELVMPESDLVNSMLETEKQQGDMGMARFRKLMQQGLEMAMRIGAKKMKDEGKNVSIDSSNLEWNPEYQAMVLRFAFIELP